MPSVVPTNGPRTPAAAQGHGGRQGRARAGGPAARARYRCCAEAGGPSADAAREGRPRPPRAPGAQRATMAESNDRQQELEALHRSYKMMEMDRQKYSEESQVSRRPPVPPRPTPPRPALACAGEGGRADTLAPVTPCAPALRARPCGWAAPRQYCGSAAHTSPWPNRAPCRVCVCRTSSSGSARRLRKSARRTSG